MENYNLEEVTLRSKGGVVMKNDLNILKVQTFGALEITYGDTPVLLGKNSVTKAMRLLLILLYNGENGISRSKLLAELFENDETSNAANSLRVTSHRLKKILADAGFPEHEYIVIKSGCYYWNGPMEVEIDARQFEAFIKEASECEDFAEKTELMKRACKLYRGEFLAKLSSDEWVIMENIRLKDMYTEAMQLVCEQLMKERDYEEALRFAESAAAIYPFDEWQSIQMECYIAMNKYKEAMGVYEHTATFLLEELGIQPSERMMEQFRIMSQHISNRPQIIDEIQSGLKEAGKERGAFYCSLPSFRDGYRIIRRGMERSGQSVFLLVCTIIDGQGRPMEASKKLDIMSNALYEALHDSLRRSDSYTKYNQGQYLVMLMGTNQENCKIVTDRITKNFSKEHRTWMNHLNCTVSSMYDIQEDEEWL